MSGSQRAAARRCPICGGGAAPRSENRAFPFCGARCKQIDLGAWLGEGYVISRPLVPEAAVAWPGGAEGEAG